jgi:hypothetical protein
MIASSKQDPSRLRIPAGEPSPAAELSIVIVNWNSAGFVRQCLRSIQHNRPAFSYEVIVVDSGSFDGCGEMLNREFPGARFVQSRNNVGFASANNMGAQVAGGRFLLFLNPDTEIIGDALNNLIQALNQQPDAGLVGARLLNTDGSLQTSCIQSFPTVLNQALDAEWLRRIFPRSHLWGMKPLFQETQIPSPVEVISGACIMIKRSVFQHVSGFDERYFMYSEDLDLCWRVRQAGFDCMYVPDAQIVHHGGGSSNSARNMFSNVMTRESVFRFLKFHRGRPVAWCYRAAMGISSLVRLPLIVTVNGTRRLVEKKIRQGSFRKWIAILRWSIGLESWAAKKSGGNETSLPTPSVSKNCSLASSDAGDCR